MEIIQIIQGGVANALDELFEYTTEASDVLVNVTKKEFDGDYTVVIFPYVKKLRKSPVDIGDAVGSWLVEHLEEVTGYGCIQGFLNLSLSGDYWLRQTGYLEEHPDFWKRAYHGEKILIEFSSPNTNKPLHLGHIRNILLGWSCAQLYTSLGYDVTKTQIINDRGIAICKSMLAWKKFANGQTPAEAGMKSDHFVGHWYVRFEQAFQEEYRDWQMSAAGKAAYHSLKADGESPEDFFSRYKNRYFNEESNLGKEARKMLQQWESNDPAVRALWEKMNQWVYDGFEKTYQSLGVGFDTLYYESDTYLLGKDLVEKGLSKGIFYRKNDGSVWVNLEDEGMDEKLLLRSDGTSVYMTQDLGTADLRYQDTGANQMVYVVGDEQNYHFKALFAILGKLGAPYAGGLHHLSYGMIDLPTGKMKSREGTVVDADDLIADVVDEASAGISERGELVDLPDEKQVEITRKIGMAALKFFMIKIDPRKRMTFDPKASVDLQGQTGPYIQNAYVRIMSVLRKGKDVSAGNANTDGYVVNNDEKKLIVELTSFPQIVENAAHHFDPSQVANYCYQIAKEFHRYYHEHRILNAETAAARAYRLVFIQLIARVLEDGMQLLGIEMPERM